MIKIIEIGWRQGETEGKIEVQVLYSARRTLGLEVKEDGRVLARVPQRTSNKAVMGFVKERQEWIVENWFRMKKRAGEKEKLPRPAYETDPKLEAALKKKAREKIEERAAWFAAQMKVDYGRISIRAAKTRWGSCSGKGNLNFHWKLILMPPEVLDYVVVHELAHRKEMNHSARFWAEVEKILPDYRQRRKWLKENGGLV